MMVKPACFGKDYNPESNFCNYRVYVYGHNHCLVSEQCKRETRRNLIWKLYQQGVRPGEITKRIYGHWLARLEANVWATIHSFERKLAEDLEGKICAVHEVRKVRNGRG